jgi:hypothetical protein
MAVQLIYTRVWFDGSWWLKITPPWTHGYRPLVTYRRIT